MAVNSDKPARWKADIVRSVDLYNEWFLAFAPDTYRNTRVQTTKHVEEALRITKNLTALTPSLIEQYPRIVSMLRMATAPPIARDRLVGLAGASKGLVYCLEEGKIPTRMDRQRLSAELQSIAKIILRLADRDLFPWLDAKRAPSEAEIARSATVVADRLCGAMADPIVRNAQEQRQLALIKSWLEARNYRHIDAGQRTTLETMPPGTFAFRLNIPVSLRGSTSEVNIPVDVAVSMKNGPGGSPLLIEAKSAGDFTNVNKRRKEEAAKMAQLRATYRNRIRYILFLCGYFDSGYLGYEAAEGIDWVWEHRIDDLAKFGL